MKENYKLVLNILIPIIFAIIVNGIIYALKWNNNNNINTKMPYLPPGYIIGLIWLIIFGFLGVAHYILTYRQNSNIASNSIIFLLIFCLAYPFLTSGLKNIKIALILNLLTFFLSIIVSIIVAYKSLNAFYFLIPLLLWAGYVNYIFLIIR